MKSMQFGFEKKCKWGNTYNSIHFAHDGKGGMAANAWHSLMWNAVAMM